MNCHSGGSFFELDFAVYPDKDIYNQRAYIFYIEMIDDF